MNEHSGRLSESLWLHYRVRVVHAWLLDALYTARILAIIALKTLIMLPLLITLAVLIVLDWFFE